MIGRKIITDTIRRPCCHPEKDLVRIGLCDPAIVGRKFYYCVHCGRHWEDQGGSEPDSPGLQPLPWENQK